MVPSLEASLKHQVRTTLSGFGDGTAATARQQVTHSSRSYDGRRGADQGMPCDPATTADVHVEDVTRGRNGV